ncbi:NirD/YgiW/YdeI family stress tolerance protein, partial [Arthrospira platensis SPKY1]|nr:NirD/YgiW/YdeI family stress tolerance protein [Arthrospira platensis SPKY1]
MVVASASGEEETATAPREGAAPVAVIAPDSAFTAVEDVRRGQRVTLRGEVVALADEDEFILADETGRIRVYIGWRNDMPVDVGEVVTVVGMADDDVVPGMR